jgi:predicted MFS family arabinose efflux permease
MESSTPSACEGVSVLPFSMVVGRPSQRWPAARLIALGAVAALAGCALFATSQEVAAAVVATIVLGPAWTAMHSTLQTSATEVLPGARATVVPFFAGALFVGSSLAAALTSSLADHGRYGVLFATGAVLAGPLGLVATAVRAVWHSPAATPSAP